MFSPLKRIKRKIRKLSPAIEVREERGCLVLEGQLDDWEMVVKAGHLAVDKKHYHGVINDIKLKGFEDKARLPKDQDLSLEGETPQVLIIGGGITGCAIARELSRWKLDTLLLEKGPDVASGASKANGGVIHVGINFPRHSQKLHYNLRGNKLYAGLSRELDVPFEQKGQALLCSRPWEKLLVKFLAWRGRKMGIQGVVWLDRKELLAHEPCLPPYVIGGMYMPSGGLTSPMEMTVALAENAVRNGVRICLETAVLGMETEGGLIRSVKTNRGRLYPQLVINAAGVYADVMADMAGDRTFTIHPRRGTDIITDKKAGYMVRTSMERSPFSLPPDQRSRGPLGVFKDIRKALTSTTKGIGLIHSLAGNMLLGPNAVETPCREDTASYRPEVEAIMEVQKKVALDLDDSQIIAYFTGVRAPSYEEDFVVRKGLFTDNIIEAAAIQSPGLTAAPAIAQDVAAWAVDYLSAGEEVQENPDFHARRKAPPRLASLPDEERAALIRDNPDYGLIICRCEEISKGEILDALRSPLQVPTMDAIKRRLRPGMGRCQGSFCGPLLADIIARERGMRLDQVRKEGPLSVITYGETKEARP